MVVAPDDLSKKVGGINSLKTYKKAIMWSFSLLHNDGAIDKPDRYTTPKITVKSDSFYRRKEQKEQIPLFAQQ